MALNDRLHALGTFTALLPLDDVDAASTVLEGWTESPFAAVEGTHFARFVVVADIERAAADQLLDELGPYLMFSAFFDVEPDAWLAALPPQVEDVLRCCRGFPSAGPATVRAWLHEHRVPATAIFGAYAEASVAEVREALAFRERFRAFVWDREAKRDGLAAFRAWRSS
jgi:hypothetical protein